MSKKTYTGILLLLIVSIVFSSCYSALAANDEFKVGMAYLLGGSTVYADTEGKEPLFQVLSDTGVYVTENATGKGKALKSNDMLKITIAVDGQAQDVYVWFFDIQYMSKKQISNYNPGKGVGAHGVILGNATIGEAATPRPVITRDPSKVVTRVPATEAPTAKKTSANKTTATPKSTPKITATPAPTKIPEPVFPAYIAVQPEPVSGPLGAPVTVKIIAENAIKYQWQYKAADKDWMNLPNNAEYSGSKQASMTFVLTEENAAWKYRCMISGAENSLTSDEISVTLSNELNILTQPTDAVAAIGAEAVFQIKAVNVSECIWQTEIAPDEWQDIEQPLMNHPDEYTYQLIMTATDALKGTKYRCMLKGLEGDETASNSASLITGAAARIIVQPEDVTAANGGNAVLHVEAENAISYQWQYDDGISGWWDLVERDDRIGTNTDTLTLVVRPTVASFTYRCVITGAENTVESKAVSIKIK